MGPLHAFMIFWRRTIIRARSSLGLAGTNLLRDHDQEQGVSVDVKDVAAVVGPVVAIISLGLNAYLAYLLRTKRPHVARVGDVREAFQKLINALGNRVMNTPPFVEIWDFGFESLEEI